MGDKIPVVIKGAEAPAPEGRAAGDTATTFVVGKFYDVTINDQKFEGVECKVANQLTVEYVIKEADKTGLKITVKAIVEAKAPVTPTEGTVTVKVVGAGDAGTYTADTTTLTEAGKEYTITITDSTYKTGDTYVVAGEGVTGVDNKDGTITVTYTTPAEIPAEGMTLTVTVTKTAATTDPGTETSVIATVVNNKDNGKNEATFQAHYTGDTAPTLDAKTIAAALTAAGYATTADQVDLTAKKATTAKGEVVWANTNVERLFAVSYPGAAKPVYLPAAGGEITGVTSTVKYLISDALNTSASGIPVVAGKATTGALTKDVTLVEAFSVAAITSGAVPGTGANSGTNYLTVSVVADPADSIISQPMSSTGSNLYIRKGAEVEVDLHSSQSAAVAGEAYALSVSGKETTLTVKADGSLDPNTVIIDTADASGVVTLTASKAPAVYNVYVNDVLQTPNAAGKVQMTGLPAGAKLVTEKVAGTLAATNTPTNVTDRGVLEYAVAAADVVPNTTDIKLYTAWDVTTATATTDYSVYTKNPVGAADAPDAVNAANLLFKTMDSTTLYFEGADIHKILVAKAASGIKLTNVQKPSTGVGGTDKGVWSWTVDKSVASDPIDVASFKEEFSLGKTVTGADGVSADVATLVTGVTVKELPVFEWKNTNDNEATVVDNGSNATTATYKVTFAENIAADTTNAANEKITVAHLTVILTVDGVDYTRYIPVIHVATGP